MRFLAKEFEGMPLLLQRICGGIGSAVHLHIGRLHLHRLAGA